MHQKTPGIKLLLKQLPGTPSISCASPDIDQGNRHVIDLLTSWFADLDFHCEIQTLA